MIDWPLIGDIARFVFWGVGIYLMFYIPRFSRASQEKISSLSHVSIIIPARNEEHRIQPLLTSLRQQSLQDFELIVVDDESTDQTSRIAKLHGATVITSQPLPVGWRGKSWASHQGALASHGQILVFLDADTQLTKDGLLRILHVFNQNQSPLSVQPYHLMKRPYERLSLFFNLIVMMATNSFTPLQDRAKPLVFFGPCQVVTKEDYLAIGGHETVKGSILEDIAIGKRFLASKRVIRNYGGFGAISFRMYPDGLRDIFQGWSKNFATGAMSIGVVNLILISLWITGVFGGMTVAFLSLLGEFNLWRWILYGLFGIQLYWMAQRIGNFTPLVIVLYPIHVLFFVIVFINSWIRTKWMKSVSWKGRNISTK